MNWIENFNSATSTDDAAPQVWKKGDRISDVYTVNDVCDGETGQISFLNHSEWWTGLMVKSPRPEQFQTPEQQARFIREAETCLYLGLNPYIVSCYFVLRLGGLPRIFFEQCNHGSLAEWIRSGELYEAKGDSDDEVLWLILRVAIRSAWGLHYAHTRGVVHQDVKPANILLDVTQAKVANFGSVSGAFMTPLTDARAKVIEDFVVPAERMTAAYCSPEQARGEQVSPRTDIWSWAVTVLEMFAGAVAWESGPLAASALEEYLRSNSNSDRIPRMPEGVAAVLRRCLQEDPAKRPASLLAVADELEEIFQKLFDDPGLGRFVTLEQPPSSVLNNRALSYFSLGRTDEALAIWDESLKFNPTHHETVFNRGLVRWRAGKIDDDEFLSRLKEVKDSNSLSVSDSWGQWDYSQYLITLAHLERGDWLPISDEWELIERKNDERSDRIYEIYRCFFDRDEGVCYPATRGEHPGGIRAVSFMPDAKWALSGGNDRTLRLWDVSFSRWMLNGGPIRIFTGHTNDVRAVCVSKDGKHLASGSADTTVKLWAVNKSERLRTFRGHTGGVTSVCFDSHGKHLFSSGSYGDLTAKMWDVSNGKCIRTFAGHTGPINALALDANDRRLVTCGGFEDNTLKLWDVETGECLRTFVGHTDIVQSVSISADGNSVLSGGSDRTVRLWDAATGACLRTLRGHRASVFSVAQTPDGRYAVSGGGDGVMKLWDLSTGQCLRTFKERNHPISSVAISADGAWALSGASDGDSAINLARTNVDLRWFSPLLPSLPEDGDQATMQEQNFLSKLKTARTALETGDLETAVHNAGSMRYEDGYEKHPQRLSLITDLYWKCDKKHLEDAILQYTFEGHALETETVGGAESVHPVPYHEILSRGRMTLKLWNSSTGKVKYEYRHSSYLTAAALSPSNEHVVFAFANPPGVNLLRLTDGQIMRGFYGFDSSVTALAFDFYHNRMLTNGNGPIFKIWDSHRREVLHECVGHTGTVTSLCMSADRKFALSGSTDQTVRLWDVETGKCLRVFNEQDGGAWISSTALSRNGNRALSASSNGVIRFWDTTTGNYLRTINAHKDFISQVGITADGKFAASASWDRTVKLWDLSDGFCMKTLDEFSDRVTSVAFNGREDYLVAGNDDGTVKVWKLIWELKAPELPNDLP